MKEKTRSEIEDKYKWNLKRIYESIKEFDQEFKEVETLVEKIISYKGKIMLNGNTLYEVLELRRIIDEKLSRLYIYAQLYYYEDMTNNKSDELRLKVEKFNDDIEVKMSFMDPEILDVDYKPLLEQNKDLKDKYSFMLEKMFRYKKYTRNEEVEEVISLANAAMGSSSNAFSKLNNSDIDLGYIYDENGKKVKYNNQLFAEFIRSHNRNLRKRAFIKMHDYYKKRKQQLSALYEGKIKENFFITKVRGFNSPLEKSLYSDNISKDVYTNLINTAHKNLGSLHRYMNLKSKLLGVKNMHMYDIYAEPKFEAKEHIKFDEARKMINEALKPLGEKYIEDLQKAYEERWIDIYPNLGKRSGAFQWGPYRLPYVCLNYNYKVDDVSTAAHELGHAMHTYYSDNNQTSIYNAYPIFLAEIASTVNEVLLSEYLLENAKTDEEKIRYLLDFLEKSRATIFRQVMFAEFEMIIHDYYQDGKSLTEQLLSDTYQNLNKKYFGNKIVSDEYIRYEWMRIPHFYTSFYVYKYATGLSAAIAIATDILEEVPGIREKYLEFLGSGCSKYPLDTLKNVGVDLTTSDSIDKAFKYFDEKCEELKILIEKNK